MKTTKGDKHYVIAPLNCLSINISYKFLIKCIINYGIVCYAQRRYSKIIKYKISQIKDSNIIDDTSETKFIKHLKISYRKIKKRRLRNKKSLYLGYKIIRNYHKKFEKIYGTDANILIGSNLLNDILKYNSLKEKQFRVLCAIYSKIGKSDVMPILNNEIRLRTLGYRNREILEKESLKHSKRFNLYSNKILAKEIPRLKKGSNGRGFFDRVKIGRVHFYSRTINKDALDNYVLKNQLKRNLPYICEKERNSKIKSKYKSILQGLKANTLNINEIMKTFNIK